MKPQHRTPHIRQSRVQTVSLGEIDSRHANPTSAVVALVVGLDGLTPVFPGVLVDVFAEADVDEEVAVGGVRLEGGGGGVGGPGGDVVFEEAGAVPAAEGDGVGVFVIEGGAEGDDAGDLLID